MKLFIILIPFLSGIAFAKNNSRRIPEGNVGVGIGLHGPDIEGEKLVITFNSQVQKLGTHIQMMQQNLKNLKTVSNERCIRGKRLWKHSIKVANDKRFPGSTAHARKGLFAVEKYCKKMKIRLAKIEQLLKQSL